MAALNISSYENLINSINENLTEEKYYYNCIIIIAVFSFTLAICLLIINTYETYPTIHILTLDFLKCMASKKNIPEVLGALWTVLLGAVADKEKIYKYESVLNALQGEPGLAVTALTQRQKQQLIIDILKAHSLI